MNTLPTFNDRLAIPMSTVQDLDIFKEYLTLNDLRLEFTEPGFYIVSGEVEKVKEFARYWNYYL